MAYTVALVVFWGMARLGELLETGSSRNQILVKDIIWDPKGTYLRIKIREAKTAVVGEVQEIHCQHQKLLLDPLRAIRRLIISTGATEDDVLFSYRKGGQRITLTKSRCLKIFEQVWEKSSETKLTGHSFRVGGASLRWNLDSPLDEIVLVGRWRSKAYNFIREYTEDKMSSSERLLKDLQLS